MLGPTLFLILYDDIVEYLYDKIYSSYIIIGGAIVLCLMFADDTVLFACNWEDCKNAFYNYVEYTRENGLSINVSKTIGMAFRKNNRRARVRDGKLEVRGARFQFMVCEHNLEDSSGQVQSRFKYLHFIFDEG